MSANNRKKQEMADKVAAETHDQEDNTRNDDASNKIKSMWCYCDVVVTTLSCHCNIIVMRMLFCCFVIFSARGRKKKVAADAQTENDEQLDIDDSSSKNTGVRYDCDVIVMWSQAFDHIYFLYISQQKRVVQSNHRVQPMTSKNPLQKPLKKMMG